MSFQIRSSLVLIILFSLIGSGILIPNSSAQEETQIPHWIKDVAGWWAKNEIEEKEFMDGLSYILKNSSEEIHQKYLTFILIKFCFTITSKWK